ncbi:MAG: arginine/lysine/histidine transporter system substrate-binding protein [Clostridiales bacterium]|jgi:polar amino acid transport system substrate-binding protein|nr:arginine/lysine/histidine transporter system substrate-binding protein [Clostridiales bacterium]MDK2933157.1 arginine/lysine/histidine transporter system substrate-binding protein [Clostridiales bacterium]
MKKSLFTKIAIIVLSFILAAAFVGCGKVDTMKRVSKNKVVIMGTNAEFPPFEYRNDKGEVDGFDAAMAKEIAKELGVELKIEDMAFDSLLNALASGKIDFVAAGMSVTEERLENADFSEAYYTASQKIIVKKDNDTIKGKADLEGKKIGVQEGTTGDLEASKINNVQVSRFKKGIDAVMDLKNGKIDAVVIDASPAEVFVSKNDDLKILEEDLTEEEYAIAVRKGDKELLDVINKVIKNLKDSGKYDELVTQYIGQ